MPNIRIMNWNIQQLSWDKIRVGNMPEVLARVVVGANVDILVLIELKLKQADAIMTRLAAAMDNEVGTPGRYYWLRSQETGKELYGFIVRDMAVIRPLGFTAHAGQATGTGASPLKSLHAGRWRTWPAALPNAAPAALPPRPLMPIVDMFGTHAHPRAAQRLQFAGGKGPGSNLPPTSYGSRAPCVAMFMVRGAATTLIPLVVCHYGAVRSGRNGLGQQQISQLRTLHISQLFRTYDATANPAPPATSGYLDVDGVATPVRNILFTGDFNVDFLVNQAGAGGSLAETNHRALAELCPKTQAQGSAPPPAAAAGVAPLPAPGVPFAGPFAGPDFDAIPAQALRPAVTAAGTMIDFYKPGGPVPADTDGLRGAAFDNFFYGGDQAAGAVIAGGVGADSGEIVDIPANIAKPPVAGAPPLAPGQLNLGPLRAAYASQGTKNANLATRLRFGRQPLTVLDRWIGTRFLSDHLPVVLQFPCP